MSAKLKKLLTSLTVVAAAFVLVCYVNFTVSSIIMGAGTREIVIGSLVCAAAGVVVLLRDKLPYALRWICCAGMLFYVVSYSAFAVFILSPDESVLTVSEDNEDGQVLIIFGCRSFGLEPGNQLRERLDRALELIAELPEAKIIVSGGQGANETAPEAEAMRAYLVAHGVDDELIYTESASSSTEENIRFSIDVMERNGLAGSEIIAVSSYYHLPRIRLLAAHEGFEVATAGSGSGGVLRFFSVDLVREYMAYVKLLLRSIVS